MKNIKIKYLVNEMRIKKGLSINELSRRTNLQYQVVSGLCSGKRSSSPKLSTLVIYAAAMNCSVKDLFIEEIEENESGTN